jgi:hypothetical protein
MLKPINESNILKRYSQPPGDPPSNDKQNSSGSISVFPSSPLDMPSETFENALKRRDRNHKRLIQWIQQNLHPDVHYGRQHIFEQCPYARAGVPHQCRNFSHMSMLTLWKGGAEKILGVLGLSVHFPNLYQYELCCVHKQEITQVLLKCELKTVTGKLVAEGTGARHIKQDGWDLNKAIKMTQKSAIIDATIRVADLAGLFIKTHQHTVKYKLPHTADCNNDALPPRGLCHSERLEEKPITDKQKHLIQTIAGRKGLTIDSLKTQVQSLFNRDLDNLDRVDASKLIQHLNG